MNDRRSSDEREPPRASMPFNALQPGSVGGLYEHSGYDFATGRTDRGASPLDRVLRLLPPSLVSSHAHAEHHRRWHVSYSDGFGSPGLCDLVFRTRWDLRR